MDFKRLAVAFGLEVLHRFELRGRFLQVGGVVTVVAAHHLVLARRSAHHELLRLRSAHGARIGFNHHVLQSAAVENAAIGVVMFLIGNVKPGGIDVERVRILHDELPHPQQPGPGPRLIAKLGLNLIPDLRQLLVTAQLFARDLGHDFFFGHAQAEIGALAVFQAKQVVAHHRPAPAGLPKLARMQRWQVKFLADLVHLLADDGDDLVERPVSQKKIGVNSGSQLANVTRPDQKFVAGDLGVRRSLAQRRNKEVLTSDA